MLKILEFLKFKKIDDYQDIHKSSSFNYNYLLGLAMLYMMCTIVSGLTVYKLMHIGIFVLPAGIIMVPLIYSISNVTTEVYGFPVARNMIWWFIFVSSIFTIISTLIAHIPSSESPDYQHAYQLLFGSMPRIFIAGTIGSIAGLFFNNYVVSKYKVIMKGKKYWLRSIISTAGGELIYNIIAYPIMWIGRTSTHELIYLILSVSLFKITITGLVWPFECFLAAFLKRKERLNTFDKPTDYRLFTFHVKPYVSEEKPGLQVVK